MSATPVPLYPLRRMARAAASHDALVRRFLAAGVGASLGGCTHMMNIIYMNTAERKGYRRPGNKPRRGALLGRQPYIEYRSRSNPQPRPGESVTSYEEQRA